MIYKIYRKKGNPGVFLMLGSFWIRESSVLTSTDGGRAVCWNPNFESVTSCSFSGCQQEWLTPHKFACINHGVCCLVGSVVRPWSVLRGCQRFGRKNSILKHYVPPANTYKTKLYHSFPEHKPHFNHRENLKSRKLTRLFDRVFSTPALCSGVSGFRSRSQTPAVLRESFHGFPQSPPHTQWNSILSHTMATSFRMLSNLLLSNLHV